MAFQNSTGGIILDATLTDTGRKYMAQGKFKVVKFALGDDEIDYTFVVNPDGKTDAEIPVADLPPILEAFGSENANIQYGLLSLQRPDILYLPILRINNKVNSSAAPRSDDGFIYMSVNKQTRRMLLTEYNVAANNILEQASHDTNMLFIESGIHVPGENYIDDLYPTEYNKKAYIVNLGLYDKYFMIYANSTLVKNLLVSPSTAIFRNNHNNVLKQNFGPLQNAVKITLPELDDNYDTYKAVACDNKIFYYPDSGFTGDEHSVFQGPRASIMSINLELTPELLNEPTGTPNHRYSLYGTTNNDLFGSGNLYDFIDTTIYIQGLSTNYRISVPIRIVRYVEQ